MFKIVNDLQQYSFQTLFNDPMSLTLLRNFLDETIEFAVQFSNAVYSCNRFMNAQRLKNDAYKTF